MIQAARAVTQAGVYISGLVSFDVRFTSESGHQWDIRPCPLCANKRRTALQQNARTEQRFDIKPERRRGLRFRSQPELVGQ
jgi:hypothetical protein